MGAGNPGRFADYLVERRGFEPMAIAGAGRSRATESDGGQARRAEGLQLTRVNGDCGLDGVNSVGDPEPERTAWLAFGSVAIGVAA